MLFGIQMASQLMLLCHLNKTMLETVAIQSKLPLSILDKITLKLAASQSGTSRVPSAAANDDDDDDNNIAAANQVSDNVIRAIDRYVKQPDVVYLRRHPNAKIDSSLEPETQKRVFSRAFLDRLNTLYPVDIVAATSQHPSTLSGSKKKKTALSLVPAAAQDAAPICFTRTFDDNEVVSETASEAKKRKRAQTAARPRTQRRAGRVAPMLLKQMQQQHAQRQNRQQYNVDEVPAVPGSAETGTDGEIKIRRQKRSQTLVNKLSEIHRNVFEEQSGTQSRADARLLTQYSDVLCDNISDPSMLSKTKSTSSQTQTTCVCGAFCTTDDKIIYVSVIDGEPPSRGFMCNSCQSSSQNFERISLDLQQINVASSSSAAMETMADRAEQSALTDAMQPAQTVNQFLGSLLVSFCDPSILDAAAATTSIMRTTHDISANHVGTNTSIDTTATQTNDIRDLQPRLDEMRKKLSNSLLPESRSDTLHIERMFRGDNF